MDAGASQSPLGAKTPKLFGGQDASQEKDAISRLPEDILVHILSFLSTKEAVKTSILSKRWKYLCVSVPNFFFCDSSCSWYRVLELGARFLDSVERALFLRNTSRLGDFYLSLTMHVVSSRLHSWLSAAIEHKVRKLVLVLPEQEELVLPGSLFSSKSLRHFSLHAFCTLKVPSFISLSGLKDLHLNNVVFQDDQSAEQLFSGCPVLEDLTLVGCNWENIKEITIESPTLRSFIFSDDCFYPDPLLNGKIIISALNLERLDVSSYLTVELLPHNLISLNSAQINMDGCDGWQEQCQRMVKLLSGLHNVNSLCLSFRALELLLCCERLPLFDKLVKLKIDSFSVMHREKGILDLLQCMPNLEKLSFPYKVFGKLSAAYISENVPSCLLYHLRMIKITVFHEYKSLDNLKYLLKNASVLEKLDIHGIWSDKNEKLKIAEELSASPRKSKKCSILVVELSSSQTNSSV